MTYIKAYFVLIILKELIFTALNKTSVLTCSYLNRKIATKKHVALSKERMKMSYMLFIITLVDEKKTMSLLGVRMTA